ncbi:hypothetical protein K0T92_16265 [Paenibacillus oenotherae]|uniref:Uncharacterized protein n=1 Tax=Paenibacillus oenotherae TaxID=1435645 RepID=A0ABS7DAV3_9BACL|nr:hypothetical protein [Paenibacillus oenotherae]MBW7476288.1 hypothetical protein [Paenibacillus oenotherae]
MEQDQLLIHVLRSDQNDSLRAALSDFISLSGILAELASSDFWLDTDRVLETLRLLDIIMQATLYKSEWQLRDDDAVIHRYNRIYGQRIRLNVKQFLNVCRKYNWITTVRNPPVRFLPTGKRMIAHLFRIANDALAYHMQPQDQQALYLAIHDSKIGEAYEDEGIGAGDLLAGMISNLEDASEDLEMSMQRYVYEGRSIQKVEELGHLLDRVKVQIDERLERSVDLIPNNRLQLLHERAQRAFADTHSTAYPVLGHTASSSLNRQEKTITQIDVNLFLKFISEAAQQTYRPIEGQIGLMNILLPLENNASDYEELGIWWPQQLPMPLSEEMIRTGMKTIEKIIKMERPTEPQTIEDLIFEPPQTISQEELKKIQGNIAGLSNQDIVDTRVIQNYLKQKPKIDIQSMINDVAENWEDAANHLLSVSAVISQHLAYLEKELKAKNHPIGKLVISSPDDEGEYIWAVQASEKLLRKE